MKIVLEKKVEEVEILLKPYDVVSSERIMRNISYVKCNNVAQTDDVFRFDIVI
jgi:hypothetical protein